MPRSYKTRSGARNARTGLKGSANRLDPDFDDIGSAGRTGRSGRHESTRSTAIRGKRTAEDEASVLDVLDSRSAAPVRRPSGARSAKKAPQRSGAGKQPATSKTNRDSAPRSLRSRATGSEPTETAPERRSAAGRAAKAKKTTARNRAGTRTATARRTRGKRTTARR